MSKTNLRPAVFLDRDGVINHDPGDYTTCIQEFTILPGVIDTLKKWTEAGYCIIVITNQGGIAKQRYSYADFEEINDYMTTKFTAAGIDFIETYFCPHHDAISHCLCRKPHSGMIEKAIHRHGIDPKKSVMIGDKYRDIEAGESAGVRGIKIDVNQSLTTLFLE
ncbi:HAD family hydrolase [Cryomorpha ignava]|uniref:D,D-heptose 1,7-bisphosphate phosphatase n=1 Tax=Cryomorpha ignava TaxID=101383 RepID=A0A7K3WVR4_9FLAO|nr:HAD family hydrolase [Cryomorpha ignava]NEN25760.1 HAD family hydrolase [Cryomorpha ignava]